MARLRSCCSEKVAKKSVVPKNEEQQLAIMAKALGHPIRLKILAILKKRKSCICGEIVDELPVAQATASQHLKVLKGAGFIRGTISGPKICYCPEPAAIAQLKKLVQTL